MRVLVTDASYKHTLGIVRSLGAKGILVTVVGSSPQDMAMASRFAHRSALVPSPKSTGFLGAILALTRNGEFDLVLPVGYQAHLELSRSRQELNASTRLEIPDYDKIRLAGDKRWVRDFAAGLGIPVPRTYCPDNLDAVVRQPFPYPVIVKAATESPGITVHRVSHAVDLLPAYLRLAKSDPGGVLPMLQEFIPGYGCGFFALYQHGVCKRIFMHRRIREYPPPSGASSCAESFYDPQVKEYGIRLLDALEWHGVAMVEFRYDTRDHQYKILEINPKFWGSLDLALACGVDFPHYLCQMANGEALEYSEEYQRGLRFHWPFSGELQLCWRQPGSTWAVLADSLDPRVKSNLWLSDWRPNLKEAMAALQSGWNRLRRV